MGLRGRLALAAVATALLVCVGTAVASAPEILYGEPTNVTSSGAVLQGSVNPSDKATKYYFEYGSSTAYGAKTAEATLPKSKAWQPVSAAVAGLAPGSTYHYRIVASNGEGSKDKTIGADHTFTTASAPDSPDGTGDDTGEGPSGGDVPGPDGGDTPALGGLRPTLGSSVVVEAGHGRVLVRRPGGGSFHELSAATELPVGSEVDARHGAIALTSALPSGRTQTGRFGGGRFQLRQGRRGYVDLYLRGRACATSSGRAHAASPTASAARGRRGSRLWGRDHGGRFRTHGRNSQATVRGTRWLVQDRCDGTLTRVAQGSVLVRDAVRHRRLVLHAGEQYLARNR